MPFKMFRPAPEARSAPTVPPGTRVYAIGDVHGRPDLLTALLDQIDEDRRARPIERCFTVFLGDLVDRGPDSRRVIQMMLDRRETLAGPVFILGNHEEMLLSVIDQHPEHLWQWLDYGGAACAESYGVPVDSLTGLTSRAAAHRLRAAIPAAHIAFIEEFADSFVCGDYLFVHAGIRPGVPLKRQSTRDLRWIRDEFLDSAVAHPLIVVHGHTISETIDERENRIGIDTGAYATGRLTALCAEGAARRYLTT